VSGGEIDCAVSDGSGGWYIGGNFNSVGGIPRGGLAHIASDLTVGALNHPVEDGTVRCLALSGGVLYFGGDFLTVQGSKHHCIAALDLAPDTLKAWDPDIIGTNVNTILVQAGTVYFGGDLYGLGANDRLNAAAVSAATAAPTAWDPEL